MTAHLAVIGWPMVCFRIDEAQPATRRFSQMFVALLIFTNFVMNAIEAQLIPEDEDPIALVLSTMEKTFTWIFALELSINLFANWFAPFWEDGWNIFDFVGDRSRPSQTTMKGPFLCTPACLHVISTHPGNFFESACTSLGFHSSTVTLAHSLRHPRRA